LKTKRITLAHGNGGRLTRALIDEVFARHLANPELDVNADAVPLAFSPAETQKLMFTTDGFTVQPLEFPGGDIGSLAVHGTTNDLAVAGAIPRYLSLSALIEEGLEIAQLERIVASIAASAKAIGVSVVAGDTKVLRRGEGGGLYLTMSGIGIRQTQHLGLAEIRAEDAILVSGPIGDHGIAVMLAREEFGLHGELCSDAASVLPLTKTAMELPGLRFMRDPTRGGLATLCYELHQATGLGMELNQLKIPIREQVQSVCDMLGYDPLYLACEGRVVAVIDPNEAEALLNSWRALPEGVGANIIGHLTTTTNYVLLRTELGGERILYALEGDPLPRIC
jgi:hydrogenase expression/formation protein HypE